MHFPFFFFCSSDSENHKQSHVRSCFKVRREERGNGRGEGRVGRLGVEGQEGRKFGVLRV